MISPDEGDGSIRYNGQIPIARRASLNTPRTAETIAKPVNATNNGAVCYKGGYAVKQVHQMCDVTSQWFALGASMSAYPLGNRSQDIGHATGSQAASHFHMRQTLRNLRVSILGRQARVVLLRVDWLLGRCRRVSRCERDRIFLR